MEPFNLPNQEQIKEESYQKIKDDTGFDIAQWYEIVELQKTFNEKVNPNWLTAGNDWNLAMILEAAELVDSTDWKWWKHGVTDWKNLEIEMIDIGHFLIAKGIETKQTDLFVSLIMSKEIEAKKHVALEKDEDLSKTIRDIMTGKFMSSLLIDNSLGAVLAFLDVWYMLDYNIDDFFKLYKMKYALNGFRQDNGYKEGTYKKIWFGEEDNVHAQKLILDIESGPNFVDELYLKLEELYRTIPEPEEKSLENFVKGDPKWSQFMIAVPEANRKIMIELAKEFQDYLEN